MLYSTIYCKGVDLKRKKKMLLNSEVKLIGEKIVLVPYRKHHVAKYHEWMKCEELQILTASDALTIEEEYQMQQSWLQDSDKCTFIVLDKATYDRTNDEIESMIGDTNIFLKLENGHQIGEIEIMIADKESRGKKLGWESVILMLLYGVNCIKLMHFEAKISTSNIASTRMFEKLQFTEISCSDVFKEVTLERPVSEEWLEWLSKHYSYQLLAHKLSE